MADLEQGLSKITEQLVNTNKKLDKLNKNFVEQNAGLSPAAQKQADEDRKIAADKSNSLLLSISKGIANLGGAQADSGKAGGKSGGMLAGMARALGGLGTGVGKAVGGFMKGVSAAAASGVQFVAAMGFLGAGLFAFGLAIGTATWLVSKLMPDIAKGLKEFKDVDGSNLINVGKGMTALGAGFAAMGVGGAIKGIGNLIGGIAEGVGSLFGIEGGQEALIEKLKKFSKLELNVENIKGNSEAMVAYGVAMTTGSASTMLGAVATLADGAIGGLGKLLGGVPVVTQLINFSKLDIDGAKVKKNAEAMVAYAGAMTAGAGAEAMKSVGGVFTMITSFTDGVSTLLGGKGTLDTQLESLRKLSKAEGIDAAKIKIVTEAMVEYSKTMAVGATAEGMKAVGGALNLVTNITDGLSKWIGGKGTLDTQLESLRKLSKAEGIDGAKIKVVTGAMIEYAKTMAVGAAAEGMKASAGALNLVTNITDGLSKWIGGKGTLDTQLESLQKLSSATGIDGAKIKVVTGAMIEYAKAMGAGAVGEGGKAVAGIGNLVTNITDGLSSLIGGDGVLDTQLAGLKKMTDASDGLDVKKIENVANAMGVYAKAMALGAAGTTVDALGAISNFVGGVVKSLGSFLGIKDVDPIADLKKFAQKSVTKAEVTQIESNAAGLTAYADAMGVMGKIKIEEGFGEAVSGILKGIGSLFTDDDNGNAMVALHKFAAKDIDSVKVKKNVAALQEFANFRYTRRGLHTGLSAFAGDLVKSVPVIEAAIMGSEKFKWFGKNIKMKGLASTDIKFDQASLNISKLRASLGLETTAPTPAGGGDSSWQNKLQKSIEDLTAAIGAVGGGNNTVLTSTTQINQQGDSPIPIVNPNFGRLNTTEG